MIERQKERPTVSYIMPVYNGEYYLIRSISSIVNQPNNDYELIIINDGSTDNSTQIIREYVGCYSSIVFIDGKNQGVNHARNIGIKAATGKYLCFIDQDDFIFSNAYCDNLVEKLNKAFENNVDFYSMKNIVSNETCKRFFTHDDSIRSFGEKDGYKTIYGTASLNPLFSFYNSKTFMKFDLSIFEKYQNTDADMQLFHMFYYYSQKCIFDNSLLFYCWVNNLNSVSHDVSRMNKSYFDTLLCWKEIIEVHEKRHKDISARNYCISYLCGAYYYYLLNNYRNIKSIKAHDSVINEFDDYVHQQYKLSYGKPLSGLALYYRHKSLFVIKCIICNSIKRSGQLLKNRIPMIRRIYEKKKFPITLDSLMSNLAN